MSLNKRELATVLAGLRLWQTRDKFYSSGRAEDIALIATDNGEIEPLNEDEIDELCERLNTEPSNRRTCADCGAVVYGWDAPHVCSPTIRLGKCPDCDFPLTQIHACPVRKTE